MAGETLHFADGGWMHVDYPDAEESLIVGGKEWRFSFHNFLGPTWLKKNGDARKCQNPKKEVWAAFEEWFEKSKFNNKQD